MIISSYPTLQYYTLVKPLAINNVCAILALYPVPQYILISLNLSNFSKFYGNSLNVINYALFNIPLPHSSFVLTSTIYANLLLFKKSYTSNSVGVLITLPDYFQSLKCIYPIILS